MSEPPSIGPDQRRNDADRRLFDDAATVPAPGESQAWAEAELRRWSDEQKDDTLPAWASNVSKPLTPMPATEVKVAKVNAWAERLRAKSEKNKAHIADVQQVPSDRRATGPSYWSTDALFAESKRIEEDHQTRPSSDSHRDELLAVFGLRADATAADAQQTYKRLVKAHHPDRWMHADPVLRERHAEHMRRVNATWQALRPYFIN